jgi:RNA polymerase sigma factor (sigma-70 family)
MVTSRREQHPQEGAIDDLLTEQASPLIDRLLRAAVSRGRLPAADVPDLAGEVNLRVLRRLRRLGAEGDSLADLDDYVTTTTHYAVDDHLRRRDPLRTRLAQRVRYVLTHTNGLAVWNRNPASCGFSEWATHRLPVAVSAPDRLPMSATTDVRRLRAVIEQILRRSAGPVELTALVNALADAVALTRQPFVPATILAARGEVVDPLARLEGHEYLRRLWAEISTLPPRQRRALLFQLHVENGDSVARLLPALGIVTMEELAAALEMSLAELLALWNELPLEDQLIATMLGITRQQVINLRKSARDRLARRLGRPR